MELDWTTFFLEIVNFLVLVWILKRFLYRPILDAIAQRRAHIEETLADARKIQDEASALKAEGENRLAEWGRKQESLQAQLMVEISAKRDRMMADLAAAAEQEREKNRALEERRHQEWLRATEEKALIQASRFAATLLSRLASPELDAGLFDILIQDLRQLSPQDLHALVAAADQAELRVNVVSAFPLDPQHRTELIKTLGDLAGRTLPTDFSEDPGLLGGVRVNVGPWVLHANLQDELAYFRGTTHGAS
ncbi:MAG TPA: F0F1 ATP synthase subunit delta [Sulfuricella sp.]|nr:F0F1 ATP synthase subunit delta [Sulfuricella sp.]